MTGKFVRGAAVLAAGAVSIAGCSRSTETTTGADGSSNDKIVKIGLIAPLTGEISSFGLGIKNSVDLAVNEANKAAKIKGYKIVLQAEDDAGKPEQGAAAATKLSSDPQVAGVIGTYNSSVAQQVAPVLQRSRIVQISPANTNPTLTRGTDDANPKRLWDTYFRTCTIDSLQAPFAADYAFNTANLKSVVTVHDKKTYGQGLVAAFETEFQRLGGKVLVQDQVGENDRDFGSLVTKITNAKPDFVFFGGEHPVASALSAQLGTGGFKGPLMGGDGIQDPKFVEGGGREGDLASNVGSPIAKLPAAKTFVDAYKAAGYKEDHSSYGALSYDAANILITALAKVLPTAADVQGARGQIVEAVQGTKDFVGVSGTTTFDQFGDTSNKTLTIYKVENKAFKDTFTGAYEPPKA